MPNVKFFEEFELIVALPEKVSLSKLNGLNDLLFAVIDDIIKKDTIFFNTLFSKITFLKQIFLAPKMQRLNSFLKIIFFIFGKTGKKKIIFTKSILDIFIFVHFEKVDPSFVFTFLCRGPIRSKRVPTFL